MKILIMIIMATGLVSFHSLANEFKGSYYGTKTTKRVMCKSIMRSVNKKTDTDLIKVISVSNSNGYVSCLFGGDHNKTVQVFVNPANGRYKGFDDNSIK